MSHSVRIIKSEEFQESIKNTGSADFRIATHDFVAVTPRSPWFDCRVMRTSAKTPDVRELIAEFTAEGLAEILLLARTARKEWHKGGDVVRYT